MDKSDVCMYVCMYNFVKIKITCNAKLSKNKGAQDCAASQSTKQPQYLVYSVIHHSKRGQFGL